jgi:hypothetical protein
MKDIGVVGRYYRVKKDGEYPWPWGGDSTRTIHIYTDDVLGKSSDGIYTKITGMCCTGIHIPDENIVEEEDNKRHLYLL